MAPPRRTSRSLRRVNPVRDLVAEKQRASQLAKSKQRIQQLKTDLPSIISDHVDEHMEKLQNKLITDFREMGQRAIEVSTSTLTEHLNERIETLEQVSEMQMNTLGKLRDSSAVAEKKVSMAVNSIERSLAEAVPGGFKLEPSQYATPPGQGYAHPQFQPAIPTADPVRTEPDDQSDLDGKFGFCPHCTSTKVRRANRQGLWEHILKFFFVAPYRCRACRHKFYRF